MPVAPSRRRLEIEVVELIPALRRFAARFYRAPSDIDDLVQETLLKAIANLEKFEEGTRLKSWLFTIMRNSFCTRFSLSKREHIGIEDSLANRPAVQPLQEWSLRGRELEEALVRLPDHYRSAIELVFIQGVSYENAAARCHCPLGTMKSRVNRARLHLARELGEDVN
ncbi:sigma-70 family RNA polymerase sigma factor [Neorhizobium sp. CSC1952]|uniref:RNA polymerase sigma factor n=1 Tax=Xaviernesmea oryzae TaxID=464029 RepID=A0A1X7GRW4_9HYPH|nr:MULTISPECIES: sigma-70 family RNA polymerase sigma factor [Rhizobium/Agrobacterium group]WJR66097.1 sigma-70 family RNA polymerase sigma factor [Rhizobium sp. CSC1952]SMF73093.1 RNA polymerase sigma-70 factor, ECF subfamily [Xaviernesmea oryzae]